jgi:DNA adenine methylase
MTYYQGGKKRLGKEICNIILDIEKKYSDKPLTYFEPFCGMLGVAIHVTKKNPVRDMIMNDYNPDIISMWKAVQEGWKPPKTVSKKFFNELKNSDKSTAERGFVGFACSYNGNLFHGFRTGIFLKNSRKTVIDYSEYIQDFIFLNKSYEDYSPKDMLIYCDPPYKNNGLVNDFFHNFNHDKFWDIMRKWSKDNIVIISEYTAPKDFKCIWSKETNYASGPSNTKNSLRTEKLFIYKTN